ncbi:hypothetical protein [Thermincola potens]|nr:hypothetical protein [Thermincola potens]
MASDKWGNLNIFGARKTGDKKAGGSRMFEDGEGRREVRYST